MSTNDDRRARLLERLQVLTGASRDEAERTARAVRSVLGESLPAGDRSALDLLSPRGAAPPSSATVGVRVHEAAMDFYARVAARSGAPLAVAVEHAQAACRALAEVLDDDARRHLASRLPDALAPLFELPRPDAAPPSRPPHPPRHERSLAAGRPGSAKPVAESHTAGAHTHSVAHSDNPHGDTKLSSSPGATQEREDETLATGKPGPQRPIGGG